MPKGGAKVIFIVTNMSTQCGTANKYYFHLYYHLKKFNFQFNQNIRFY